MPEYFSYSYIELFNVLFEEVEEICDMLEDEDIPCRITEDLALVINIENTFIVEELLDHKGIDYETYC